MVETKFMSLPERFQAPPFSEEARRNYARRIRFRDPRNAELQAALERDPASSLSTVMEWAIDERQKLISTQTGLNGWHLDSPLSQHGSAMQVIDLEP
jgi:hypothetical protein